MAEDLMQTQTGGEGETVQLSPEVQQTPQQFDVNLPSAQQTPPSEPVQPVGPPMAEAPIVANQPVETEQVVQEVDSEQPEEEAGFMDWYSGDVTSAAEKILQDQTVEPRQDIQPTPIQEPVVADEQIKVRSINGIPVEDEVDEEIASAVPSSASDEAIESEPVKVLSINGIPTTPPKFEGVGTLPVMPLGVEADEFIELRNKYKDYNIETDIWGNVKATKKESGKPQGKKPTTTTTEKPKATVKEGQVLSYQYNEDFDYKIEDGFWRRKSKGSNNWQTLTNEGSIKALNNYFKTNIPNVKTYTGKPGYDYAIIDNQWNIRKKGDSSWMVMNNPDRVKALNKMHKKSVSVPSAPSAPQTGLEGKLERAGGISKTGGFELGTQAAKPVSAERFGNPLTQGTSKSLLFSSDAPVGMYQSPASIQASAQERTAEIERQRQNQLMSAKTEAQRQKINQDFDKEISKSKERERLESETAKGVSKGLAEEASRPKPPVVKKKVDILKEFNVLAPEDILSTNADVIDKMIIQPMSTVRLAKEQQAEEFADRTYNQAVNFIDKDLDAWRKTTGNALTDSQFNDYKDYQAKLKNFLKDKEDLSPQGALYLAKQIEKVDKQFANSVENNRDINKASEMGQSVSEYQLDQKRKLVSELVSTEELKGKNEVLGRAKDLFNATAAIHDFVSDYLKDGSVFIDKNGKYKVNNNLPAYKKEFIEKKLDALLLDYDNKKKNDYNIYQDSIDKLRYSKKLLTTYVSEQQDIADDNSRTPQERQQAQLKIKEANRKIYGLNNEINDLRTQSGGLLSTDPELIMKSIAGVAKESDLEAVFKSIDKNLTPKQRFDMMYHRLHEENKRLARDYDIDTDYLDRVGARFRSMLDWESMGVKLSKEEEKYFANKKVLNALLPAYLNNEIGITEESAGFIDTVDNGVRSFLYGEDISGAQGDMTQTVMIREALNKIKEWGFEDKDLSNPKTLKELEKRQNVDWLSAEGMGEIVAPSLAIILEIVAARKISLGSLNKLKGLANLATTIGKSKGAVGYGDKVAKVYDAYENTLKSTKLGKAMIAAGEQGALFEATGEIFGSSEEEMGFLQGATGSLAGQLVGGLLSKIPANKASEIFNKVFGANADKAKKVLQRAAGIAETATGETAEEFGEELASIYQSTLDANGFFAELENRFGTFDKVMKFVVSSYALGAGMGIAMNNKKADELKEAMSPEDKQKVEDALTAVRTDLQEATSAMNIAANTAAEEIKAEKIVSGEAKLDGDSETEKEDAGIQFDVEGIIKNDKEGEQATEEVTESSFTQPIDLTDDKENKPGISGEERKGEEPVKEQPIVETGKEEASPSGVVQEEQEVAKRISELRDVDAIAQKEQIEALRLSDRAWRHYPKAKQYIQRIKNALYKNGYDAALSEGEEIKKEIESGKLRLKSKNPAIEILNSLDRHEGSFNKNKISEEFSDIFPRILSGEVSIDDIPDLFFEQSNLVGKKSATTQVDAQNGKVIVEAGETITPSIIRKLISSGSDNINTLESEGKTDVQIRAEGAAKISKENKLFIPEIKPSGVVQEEQKVAEEKPVSKSKRKRTAAKETGTKVVGEEIVEETKAEPAPKAEIPVIKLSEKRYYVDYNEKTKLYEVIDNTSSTNQPVVKTFKRQALADRYASDLMTGQVEIKAEKKVVETPKAEAPAETANQFKEASSISKMPMRSPKRKKAVADFDAKYGEGSYKRVSKIDANFGDIINKLENSNIVTKEC
jgi:hypothetical protein